MESSFDLNNYVVLSKLGKGSFAKVYKVSEKDTHKIYAAKVLRTELEENSKDEIVSISNEVNIMSKINHPSILQFLGYSPINFKKQNKPIIFTEYASNGTLNQIIQLERNFCSMAGWDDTKKLIIIYGIASGMSYLHSHNIIHRDLKPENILMDDFLYQKFQILAYQK